MHMHSSFTLFMHTDRHTLVYSQQTESLPDRGRDGGSGQRRGVGLHTVGGKKEKKKSK